MSAWFCELPNWPYISQLNALTDDGGGNENGDLDCGPTCLAMAVQWLSGVVLRPDSIKDAILGQDKTGPTNELQLQGYLKNRCGTPASISYPTDRGAAMQTMRKYSRNG